MMDFRIILSTVISIIILPLSAIFLSPILFFRFLLTSLPVRPKSLGRILSPLSTIVQAQTVQSPNNSTPPSVICVTFKIGGKYKIQHFKEYVYERLILARDERNQLLYPEFQQYATTWFGFSFWKWETDFSIHEHIGEAKGPLSPGKTIDDLRLEFLGKPFEPHKSPWSVLLINGNSDKESTPETLNYTCLLKFDHALSDGVSLFRALLSVVSDSNKDILNTPKEVKRSIGQQLWFAISFPIRACFNLAQLNDWKKRVPRFISETHLIKVDEGTAECHKFVKFGQLIPVSLVKEASKMYGTPFTTVLLAGLTGGLHRYLLIKEIEPPEKILVTFPIPVKTSGSKKLTNNTFTVIELALPIGESDAKKRLVKCRELYESAKNSTFPSIMLFRVGIFGRLFTSWTRAFLRRLLHPPFVISIFPGPSEQVSFNGSPVLDISFNSFGARLGHVIIVSVLSYNGGVRIALAGSTGSLGSEDDFGLLLDSVQEEFKTIFDQSIL